LKEQCHYFKSEIELRQYGDIENLIREDRAEKINTDDLISYLSKHIDIDTNKKQRIIACYPNLSVKELMEEQADSADGTMGLFLLALQELSNRTEHSDSLPSTTVFKKSQDIFDYCRYKLGKKHQESFHILILDNKHSLIKHRRITKGTLNQSLVHPREVFAPAIQLRAASIILLHNHPSGDPSPSSQDIQVTKRLNEVGDLVGISVLDHIIIGKDNYFSFIDENMM